VSVDRSARSRLSLLLVLYASATYVAVRHEFREQLEGQSDKEAAEHGLAANPEERMEEQLHEILVVLVLGLPMIVGLAGVGGYALARRALAPIDQLDAAARRITADRLHERLSVPNQQDEIGRLAAVINDTLARLESSFDQQNGSLRTVARPRTLPSVIRGIGASLPDANAGNKGRWACRRRSIA
jgi:methyl-accepting chemotaxis protein